MEWWGPSNHLEFIDKPDALTIRATSLRRPGDLIWPAVLCLVFLISLCCGASGLWLFGLIFIAAVLLFGWFSTLITEVRVTEWELSSHSNGWSDSSGSIFWKDVRGLEYSSGGENEPSGLYARKSFWSSSCLIRHLTRDETQQVIDAIYARFPNVVMAKPADSNTLFGSIGKTISLGLSGTRPESREPGSERRP